MPAFSKKRFLDLLAASLLFEGEEKVMLREYFEQISSRHLKKLFAIMEAESHDIQGALEEKLEKVMSVYLQKVFDDIEAEFRAEVSSI